MAISTKRAPSSIPRLEAGDHLGQATFHERYEAMPPCFRAELIGGIVIVPSPLSAGHGEYHALIMGRLTNYWGATPGVRVRDNVTAILGDTSEPQPDGALVIDPAYGGQTTVSDDGYMVGLPELIVEVASSSESIDLNAKRRDYEQAGVLEYILVVMRQQTLRWFVLQAGQYQERQADADGLFKSSVFPGLWLSQTAVLQLDFSQVLATLHQGLASPEHTVFVAQLQSRQGPSS